MHVCFNVKYKKINFLLLRSILQTIAPFYSEFIDFVYSSCGVHFKVFFFFFFFLQM